MSIRRSIFFFTVKYKKLLRFPLLLPFFYNDTDTIISCLKKVQPLEFVVDCILEIRRDLCIGSELKIFVDACLERLNDIAGKTVGEKLFQSLDVIGINELANAFVRLLIDLSA